MRFDADSPGHLLLPVRSRGKRRQSVDLLVRVQQRARLHGPNETRRVVRAVVRALADVLPPPLYQRMTAHLPTEIRVGLPTAGTPVAGCRDFLSRIGTGLFVDGPNAAFLARAVLEQLNAEGHPHVPASAAASAPADLRPLLTALPPSVTSPAPPVVRTVRRRAVAPRHRRPAGRRGLVSH
jgi:uncharacterized protein (DUF2267 family)